MSSGSQIRCNGCREWFPAVTPECPECGHARPGFSKPLATGKLNSHLNGMLRSADREAKVARSLGLG